MRRPRAAIVRGPGAEGRSSLRPDVSACWTAGVAPSSASAAPLRMAAEGRANSLSSRRRRLGGALPGPSGSAPGRLTTAAWRAHAAVTRASSRDGRPLVLPWPPPAAGRPLRPSAGHRPGRPCCESAAGARAGRGAAPDAGLSGHRARGPAALGRAPERTARAVANVAPLQGPPGRWSACGARASGFQVVRGRRGPSRASTACAHGRSRPVEACR